MLAEFVKALSEQAVKAAKPDIIALPGPSPEYLLRKADGTFEAKRGFPAPREHNAQDLQTIVNFATEDSAVWYCRDAVVCLVMDTDRFDRVTMDLAFTPQLTWLQGLSAANKFSQKDLVWHLRTLMKPCLGLAGDLIGVLRQVQFSVGEEGASNIQHGKQSIGKSMRAEIGGTTQIPEYVTFDVMIWESGFRAHQQIECAMEPDPATQTFKLVPIPGAIEQAICEAEMKLGDALKKMLGDGKALHYGSP